MTRLQLRTETLAAGDATGSQRWTQVTTDALLTMVHRREWAGILKANPMYRKAVITPTLTAGTFTVASLTTGSADTVANLYRIIAIGRTADGALFAPLKFANYPNAVIASAANIVDQLPERLWWRTDTLIQLTPSTLTTGQVAVAVNTFPCLVGALSADSIAVPFVEGFELILAFEAAAYMLAKAGAETAGSAALKAFSGEMRRDMLSDISRLSTEPLGLEYADSPLEWGG